MNERLKNVILWLTSQGLATGQADVAIKLKHSPGYMSHVVTGHRRISDRFIENFINTFPMISEKYLKEGLGEMTIYAAPRQIARCSECQRYEGKIEAYKEMITELKTEIESLKKEIYYYSTHADKME